MAYLVVKLSFSNPAANTISYTNNNSYVFDLSIPARLEFCGELIPTDDYTIKLSLKKEIQNTAYWKSNSVLLFNRIQRWFPYIEPILKQEGVPDDFKYLAVIESHLSNVRSSAGAAGFWQLVAGSAANYGLVVNEFVDERFHVEKATRAACKHIKDAYKIFNSWTLSAAAYNRGINGLIKAIKNQKTSNYHDLLLNPETGSFVYRILAYKTLLSSPAHFGLKKKKIRYFSKINYKTVKVDSSIFYLEHFAALLGVPKSVILLHNPWIIQQALPNPETRIFEIRVPKNLTTDYTSYTNDLQVEALQDAIQSTGQEISTEDSLSESVQTKTISVEQEVSLEILAKTYSVSLEDLRKWNHLNEFQKTIKSTTILVQDVEIKKESPIKK